MSEIAPGDLFIVSSPSGGGKTTLIARLLTRHAEDLHFSVSHTTRARRNGEEDGREYHFVTAKEFRGMIGRDEFLEWAEVHGNLYGTARKEVLPKLAAGQDVILDIDVQGVRQVKQKYPGSIAVFILPPSAAELSRRLRARGLDDDGQIEKRLANAAREIDEVSQYDYAIINDDLERALGSLEAIVSAARLRPARMKDPVERIRKQFR
ncbi:MAG TPA: guanylate kinase [Thermoanaerobaculia bacterium]|jgi:guanylate kinase|nr:guanylate kinase [Thermoanaerobaculia bacterium]